MDIQMFLATPRQLFWLAFAVVAGMLGFAYYLELVQGLEPCPLCIVQRIVFFFIGVVCLIGAVHNPTRTGRRIYAVLLMLISLVGVALAGRQIWLQTLPADQLPACLPGWDYMVEALPFQEIVRLMLQGTADCAEVNWTLFGLSIPEWSLLGFIGYLLIGLCQFLRRN